MANEIKLPDLSDARVPLEGNLPDQIVVKLRELGHQGVEDLLCMLRDDPETTLRMAIYLGVTVEDLRVLGNQVLAKNPGLKLPEPRDPSQNFCMGVRQRPGRE